jgi:hypothetical protein
MTLAALATASLLAQSPAPASPELDNADVKTVVETIQSMSGLLDNLGAAANSVAENETATKDGKPTVDKQGRPLKSSIAIITAGAAAGASIGAATKKGTQAIVIGAIAGAAAGLIYDRMTAEKKNNPDPAAEPTTGPPAPSPAEAQKQTKQPEAKQPAKPAATAPSV